MDVTMVKIMASVSIVCVTRRVPQPSDVRKVGRAAFSEPAGEVELVSCREVVWLEEGGCPCPYFAHSHLRSSLWLVLNYCFLFCVQYSSSVSTNICFRSLNQTFR